MGKKRKKRKPDPNANSDPMNARFQQGLAKVDQGVTLALMPVAWIGSAIAVSVRELLSSRFYGFFGGLIAVTGLVLSAESYWVGIAGGQPFIPKIGIQDGADFQRLLDVVQGLTGERALFLLLVAMAITLQVIESVPWRRAMSGRRRRGKGVGMLVWLLVGLGYAIDLYSVTATYRDDGIAIPTLVWGLLSLIGAEFGIGLAEVGKE